MELQIRVTRRASCQPDGTESQGFLGRCGGTRTHSRLDCETKMNTNGRPPTHEPNVAASFADLTHDVIELAELQTQLFMCDAKKTTQNARTALILCVLGVCLLLGCIPIALIALAELLIRQFEWTPAAGYAVATACGLLLSAIALGLGYVRFKNGLVTIDRSREELNRNIAWLKSSLRSRSQSRPEPHPVERI